MIDEKILTESINKIMAEEHIAGMSVAVTDAEKIIYHKGFGFENSMRPEVTTCPDALYKIASITKTITAIMVLRLCENGVLDLDVPIKKYVPEFMLSNKDATEQITLRHLLIHSAGMPGDTVMEEGSRDEKTMNDCILKAVQSFEIASLPLEKRYCYSTWGYNLIGCVASLVTKKPLSALFNEYVLKPLGMSCTTFDYFVASTYPLSMPHSIDEDGKPIVIHRQRVNTAHFAGGGLYSNTSDICRLMRMFLNDGRSDFGEAILNKDSLSDMLTMHIEKLPQKGVYYGLGISVHPFADGNVYGHLGNYHPYNASFFVDKQSGLGVSVMMNTGAPDVRHKIAELVLGKELH